MCASYKLPVVESRDANSTADSSDLSPGARATQNGVPPLRVRWHFSFWKHAAIVASIPSRSGCSWRPVTGGGPCLIPTLQTDRQRVTGRLRPAQGHPLPLQRITLRAQCSRRDEREETSESGNAPHAKLSGDFCCCFRMAPCPSRVARKEPELAFSKLHGQPVEREISREHCRVGATCMPRSEK